MEIKVDDYERLGAFYLGREYNLGTKELKDELVLYDSKDLVTHGVVLGMTGSGKTGLCLAILEEAAIDGIPAIIIDPKGDIANLMLTFPELRGEDFRPWINEEDATRKGKSPDEFAQGQADLWKKGLGEWGQDGERVRKFTECVDINIFTPGSNAGIPVSILSSLEAPPFEIIDDAELFGERIETTVTSLLALLGIDADPIQSREHILLSTIFSESWQKEENLDLEKLIGQIQAPPFEKVGVLDVESFYPEKKRFELAMAMNNLLAAPGFKTWLTGDPLDIKRMLHTPEGKPRISIFSIAHLSDAERMFFVSLLLNQTLAWMRAQSGTTSLRALLYMDEIYGYLPPTANPPSKKPMMILLKQARAFGLGVLLATQNPVDLDYKALSNMGTWFLGRLQTERDKMRVLDGLEGAATTQGSTFNRAAMEQTLAGLGARVFLLNNVNEDAPVVFHVRWVLSYLRGPMTRSQIKQLMDPKKAGRQENAAAAPGGTVKAVDVATATAATPDRTSGASTAANDGRPDLHGGIDQYFLPIVNPREGGDLVYVPAILRSAEIYISDSKLNVDGRKTITLLNKVNADAIEWAKNLSLVGAVASFGTNPHQPCTFAALPEIASERSNYTQWKAEFVDYVYTECGLEVLHSRGLDTYSRPGEDETDFRLRLQDSARQKRDALVDDLREKYAKRIGKLEDDRKSASRTLEREKAEASSAKVDTAMTIGKTLLGALFGRKSRRSASSSATRAGNAWTQSRQAQVAEDRVEDLDRQLERLDAELREEIDQARTALDPMTEELETVKVTPLKKNITVNAVGLIWLPYYRVSEFELAAAWQ
jgi:hypothetical protein